MAASTSYEVTQHDVDGADETGRYIRYNPSLSYRPCKNKLVHPGIDKKTGVEINWCRILLSLLPEEESKEIKNVKGLCKEPKLLQSLEHENIMKCYYYWPDNKSQTVHMITEPFSSENLRDYSLNYNLVGVRRVIKKWCKQILLALQYLHSQEQPVILRNLGLESVFINGNTGEIKIAEFSAAVRFKEGDELPRFSVSSIEYVAPEVYTYKHNQSCDIYSFGMCLLQMVTRERIYSECRNRTEIETRIQTGGRPYALDHLADREIRDLIEKCVVDPRERPAASELLQDPFIENEEPMNPNMIMTGESSGGRREAEERRCLMVQKVDDKGKGKVGEKLSKLKSKISIAIDDFMD